MTIGLCVAGYLLAMLIAIFVIAYIDRIIDPGGKRVLDFYFLVALFWPIVLLLILGWILINILLDLAVRYARKHNLKKKGAKT